MGAGPVKIGLLGGIASGKSTVGRVFQDLGAKLLDADRMAHEALARPETAREVGRLLGPDVLGPDGVPDRERVGRAAFGDPEKLRALEALLHPVVTERIRAGIAAAGDVPAVVVDAPLLLETLGEGFVDCLVFVAASAETRRRRAAERGWSPDELERREAEQMPTRAKRDLAQHLIVNDGSLAELAEQAAELFRRILREHPRGSDERNG
jgi:dephospho-CoA kinase